MGKIANRNIPEYVRNKRVFINNNGTVEARWEGAQYIIHSYGNHWPLAVYCRTADRWVTHESKYSPTTSRHHALIRQGITDPIVLPDVQCLVAVALHGYVEAVRRKLTQAPQPWNKPVDNVINTDLRKTT